MKINVLVGTNRQGSRSLKVANHVAAMYRAIPGVEVELIDLREFPMELLSPDAYANKPAGLAPLVHKVMESDGLVVVSPEYNGGMPGVLKLFIDMLPFPAAFEHRPVCFIGVAAGRFGALRPIEQLQAVFGYRNAYVFPERIFFAGATKSVDDNGAPTDAFVSGLMDKQVVDFVDFVRRLRA